MGGVGIKASRGFPAHSGERRLTTWRFLSWNLYSALVFFLLFSALPSPVVASDSRSDRVPVRSQEEIRGWAILNLIRFSTWPARAFSSPQSPLFICSRPGFITLPQVPAGEARNGRASKIHIKSRRVSLREIPDYQHFAGCHVLYMKAEDIAKLEAALPAIEGKPIALVSDAPGFADNGGAFELIPNENTAFFRINAEALNKTGIRLAQAMMRLGLSSGHEASPYGR